MYAGVWVGVYMYLCAMPVDVCIHVCALFVSVLIYLAFKPE